MIKKSRVPLRKQPSIIPKGYGIFTSPHLSVQLGKANGNAVAVAVAAINDNITPTQVSCTSILWKPIALQFLRRGFSVVCGEIHKDAGLIKGRLRDPKMRENFVFTTLQL